MEHTLVRRLVAAGLVAAAGCAREAPPPPGAEAPAPRLETATFALG